jgi:hypothetical protein
LAPGESVNDPDQLFPLCVSSQGAALAAPVLQLLKVPIKPTASAPGADPSEMGTAGGVQLGVAQRCLSQD